MCRAVLEIVYRFGSGDRFSLLVCRIVICVLPICFYASHSCIVQHSAAYIFQYFVGFFFCFCFCVYDLLQLYVSRLSSVNFNCLLSILQFNAHSLSTHYHDCVCVAACVWLQSAFKYNYQTIPLSIPTHLCTYIVSLLPIQ